MTDMTCRKTLADDLWGSDRTLQEGEPKGRIRDGQHPGLLLASYLRDHNVGSKQVIIDAACRSVSHPALMDLYKEGFARWEAAVTQGDAVAQSIVDADGRVAIGLGNESPLEVGLSLNFTYGTPLLPGTALKGLAGHYCHEVWGKDKGSSGFQRGGGHFSTIFGSTEDGGHMVFNDAWVLPESLTSCLVPDVMTVHHARYYQEDSDTAGPTDFDDPTPIPFLSVRGRFKVALQCDVPGENGREWVNMTLTLLLEALREWGIGAKTNSGYGRVVVC